MNWYDLICVHCKLRYGQIWTNEYPRENQCWGCVRKEEGGLGYKPANDSRRMIMGRGDIYID